MKLLFVSFLSQIGMTISQYLVETKLTHDKATRYCQDRCQSELISVHNAQEQQQIQRSIALVPEQIQDGTDDAVWIGLFANTSESQSKSHLDSDSVLVMNHPG